MTTLLVLAAGLGSRYGSLKQMDAMGPLGETVLDYSVFDAMRAGFRRVVFVIRPEFADTFKARNAARYGTRIDVEYVYQDVHDLPGGFTVPPGRVKPWGPLHAVLAARHVLHEPFAVINSDDFYGRDAFERLARFLAKDGPSTQGPDHFAMVGYKIGATLSDSGGVNRGICREQNGFLVAIEELKNISLGADGICQGTTLGGETVPIETDAASSMNMWAFTPAIIDHMSRHFAVFLGANGTSLTAESYIADVVDGLLKGGKADCRILRTESRWFGVTYPQDRAHCQQQIHRLIDAGDYHADLWQQNPDA
jgi:dTDP-glucose pyrophosphorylase